MPSIKTSDPVRRKFCLYLRQYRWGRIYKGTKGELKTAGVVRKNERFPGDPGENKHTKNTTHPDGGHLKIARISSERFEAWWRFPKFNGKETSVINYDYDPWERDRGDEVFMIQDERLKPVPINQRRLQTAQKDRAFGQFMQQVTGKR